jgi:hypothetical protein
MENKITWQSSKMANGKRYDVSYYEDSFLKELNENAGRISFKAENSNVSQTIYLEEAEAIYSAMAYFKNKGII